MNSSEQEKWLRKIPAVDEMINRPQIERKLSSNVPRFVMIKAIQDVFQLFRTQIRHGQMDEISAEENFAAHLELQILERAGYLMRRRLQPMINATGVVLHTNMGRALLPEEAVAAVAKVAAEYTNLELDLHTGKRGQRYAHVEELLCELTGAESAVVVNNNAAAVLLALQSVGVGKEAVISRGQLVEIGGSFRVPEVMAQSGVKMVEVGTTNKTRPGDYRKAITDSTALLVRVHTSNYRIIGFTEDVSLQELVKIGTEFAIPVLDDLGSGNMVDLSRWGLPSEPTVQESVRAGADIVTFSADKLMGGPQAGIIVGKSQYIDRMKKHPLLRALRLDKLTLAALESVLYLYLDREDIENCIPVLSMLTVSLDTLEQKAMGLADQINHIWQGVGQAVTEKSSSQAGGGSLPEADIPTFTVSLKHSKWSANQLAAYLRGFTPAILVRIAKDQVLIDPRTLREGEAEIIIGALAEMQRVQI